MGFPNASEIFGSNPNRNNILDVRDTIGRPSLDTFYEVTFQFSKSDIWLGKIPSGARTQSNKLTEKMSLLCTQAEIPGTNFNTDTAVGHRQGIQETFPNLRNFPPLNLVFYCDADQVIIQVLESWMSYINPVFTEFEEQQAFSRFNYPSDYKEFISITKFERDSFVPANAKQTLYKSSFSQFKFMNVWPSDLTSMRVAYGDSNVLRCSVQFAYDRFYTSYTKKGEHKKAVLNSPNDVINSNAEAVERQKLIEKPPRASDLGTRIASGNEPAFFSIL